MVVAAGVAGAGMMSQEMMRTAARMRRRRTIVRGRGRVLFTVTVHRQKKKLFFEVWIMASDGSDQDARYALSKLLQRRMVAEYETFFRARITEARFEDENNQAVDTSIGDTNMKDKQEVKKADDFLIEFIKDEEGKIVEDQQILRKTRMSKVKKKKNKVIITFFEVDANKVSNPNGVFNDVDGVGYSKADGKWELPRRIEDGWYLFDEMGSKLYFEYSIKNVPELSDDKHVDYNKKHKREIQRRIWNPEIKRIFKTSP
nr:hypothetical protein [Tanacetum cinerariifolium]